MWYCFLIKQSLPPHTHTHHGKQRDFLMLFSSGLYFFFLSYSKCTLSSILAPLTIRGCWDLKKQFIQILLMNGAGCCRGILKTTVFSKAIVWSEQKEQRKIHLSLFQYGNQIILRRLVLDFCKVNSSLLYVLIYHNIINGVTSQN